MKRWTWGLGALLLLTAAVDASATGDITTIDVSSGAATLSLDFTQQDYELVLYTTVVDVSDTTLAYSYTVSTPGSSTKRIATAQARSIPVLALGDRREADLRRKERELAVRLRAEGGWVVPSRKATDLQTGSTRTFVFEEYGNVTSDRVVQATLSYQNSRAAAYLDDSWQASSDNITSADVQSMLDQFSQNSYPTVTQAFGDPSDVDGNGKVVFLFTHLVDQVGGVAGFYASGSLFPVVRGGDGNETDMMYISPTRPLESYESLLAHEFQHLVNFNQHVLVHDGDAEEAWLNEALSHYTEDLVGGHIAGGNPEVIQDFLNAPHYFSLVSDASPLYGGNRGMAYLFLRGLLDQYGTQITAQLVQSKRVGTANVESATGQAFLELLQGFALRVFMSGNGLSESSQHNYSYRYLTEPATSHRSIPLPREGILSGQGSSVTGTLKQAGVAYVRLTGDSASQRVDLQTGSGSVLKAIVVSLPRGFTPRLALPVDYFSGITLDSPLPAVFTSGDAVVLSGSVSAANTDQLILGFAPASGEEIEFQFSATGGQFSQTLLFDASQAGEYAMTLYAGRQGELLPSAGAFSRAIVVAGTGSAAIPVDYFSGIALAAPLPTQYVAGTGTSFAGQVSDASLGVVLLVYTPEAGGTEIRVQASVSSGAFRKGFVFTPAQAGTYSLAIYGGVSGGSLPHIGGFSPITVTSSGSERVMLPVDYFERVLLDSPLAAAQTAGTTESLAGRVTDSAIEVVLAVFTPTGAGQEKRVQAEVSGGVFRENYAFEAGEVGEYELDLYGGPSGGGLPHLGGYKPITVAVPRPEAQLSISNLEFSSVTVGATQTMRFAIRSTGTQSLSVSSVTVDNPLFTRSYTGSTVAAGDSLVVSVTFSPAAAGDVTGTVSIVTDDPDHSTLSVDLTASGVPLPPSTPSADFDGDGQVGFSDFLLFAAAFGSQQGQPAYDVKFDLDSSGDVGFPDFLTFAAAFGKPVGG